MALITIAIPIYNEAPFLSETIESVLAQTFKDLEIVICDNCSTDNSYLIAKEYELKDNRVKVVRHAENIGAVENFKYALNIAKTKYFQWLGGHDVLMNDYIVTSIDYLEKHSKVVLVYPQNAIFVDINNQQIRDGACSNIESRNNKSPINRMAIVVKSLDSCTNIHGIFLTDVAKKLPFEKVIGPDNLMLAITALFGEIHAIPIQGIRRKEVRTENSYERRKRWAKSKVFGGLWGHLYFWTNCKQFKFIIKSNELSIIDKAKFCISLPGVFKWSSCLKQGLLEMYSFIFHKK